MRTRLALMISSSLPSTRRQNMKSHNALVGATDSRLPAPSTIILTIIIKIKGMMTATIHSIAIIKMMNEKLKLLPHWLNMYFSW